MIEAIWHELSAYSIPEITAVIASLIYLWLAMQQKKLCWLFAFIGSSIFVGVLWQYRLLMDAGLNAYYALMAIYGWLVWSGKLDKKTSNSHNEDRPIQTLSAKLHIAAIGFISLASLISGFLLENFTEASFPYLDSFTTWSSLFATWLIAKKVLENWLYWIVIDSLSIYLYYQKELYFTVVLFIVYTVIATLAYLQWRNMFKQRPDSYTATQAQ